MSRLLDLQEVAVSGCCFGSAMPNIVPNIFDDAGVNPLHSDGDLRRSVLAIAMTVPSQRHVMKTSTQILAIAMTVADVDRAIKDVHADIGHSHDRRGYSTLHERPSVVTTLVLYLTCLPTILLFNKGLWRRLRLQSVIPLQISHPYVSAHCARTAHRPLLQIQKAQRRVKLGVRREYAKG